jgi:hypothetical protein
MSHFADARWDEGEYDEIVRENWPFIYKHVDRRRTL